jgi:uncharacterized protein HemX
MPMRSRLWMISFTLAACGATLSPQQADHLRQQLRAAMQQPVASREERDQHSRLLADVVGKDALHGLDENQVRAAFGAGQACRSQVCEQHGFTPDDWLYEIGRTDDPKIKQLPLLIVGFDPQRRATRIWTLTTH